MLPCCAVLLPAPALLCSAQAGGATVCSQHFVQSFFSVGERAFWAMSILRQLERTQFDHTFCLLHSPLLLAVRVRAPVRGARFMRAPWLKFSLSIACISFLLSHFDASPFQPEKKAMDSQQNNMNVDGSQPLTSPSQTPSTEAPGADANNHKILLQSY